MRLIQLFALALLPICALAQIPSSFDTRHATGAGPFPFYISMQGTWTNSIPGLSGFGSSMMKRYDRIDDEIHLHGLEGYFGCSINSARQKRYNGIRMELAFQHVWNAYERLSDPQLKLRIQQNFMSLRLGMRLNVFYPITFHFLAGPILFENLQVIQDNETTLPNARSTLPRGVRLFADPLSGMDARVRMVVFDPAGTAGGLSFYFEWQRQFFFQDGSLKPLAAISLSPDPASSANFGRGAWAFGLLVPLALRWN